MRIAVLARRFNPGGGGTERDLVAAVEFLQASGHRLHIYAARRASPRWRGIEVSRLPAAALGSRTLEVLGFGLLAARAARAGGAELTLSFGRAIGADLIRCEGGAHRSYLQAARQWDSRGQSVLRALSPYHRAQCLMDAGAFHSPRLGAVAAISRLVANDLQRCFSLDPGRLTPVYNGVDLDRFQPATAKRRREVRAALQLDPDSKVAIFVGSGFARKGMGCLLDAWPLIASQTVLVVVGADRRAGNFQARARALGIASRLRWLGPRQDVPDLLAAADVLVLPSLFEAFGNVALEAMAAGLPVLLSAQCGATEVLPATWQEFVVPDPRQPEELARRLSGLLAVAPELRADARLTAERFTWQRYGEQLAALFDKSTKS
ncbi:MAG TPA: glycosyltransferase family 4 protein [Candidatus Binataceae bacterium]|nr:glycosyltransferase family 4 protein [Candidatus Binataceae bacterium]